MNQAWWETWWELGGKGQAVKAGLCSDDSWDQRSLFGQTSACNAGDPSSIPGSGRSPGEGIGYPLQYSWAFLVAWMVKNPPAMWETWVQSLGWEDPLKEGMATHSSILAWRIPKDRGARWATVHGVAKSRIPLSDLHFHYFFLLFHEPGA